MFTKIYKKSVKALRDISMYFWASMSKNFKIKQEYNKIVNYAAKTLTKSASKYAHIIGNSSGSRLVLNINWMGLNIYLILKNWASNKQKFTSLWMFPLKFRLRNWNDTGFTSGQGLSTWQKIWIVLFENIYEILNFC